MRLNSIVIMSRKGDTRMFAELTQLNLRILKKEFTPSFVVWQDMDDPNDDELNLEC